MLVVVVFGAVKAFTSSDRYGSVAMPGRETLDLPAGDVTVYYQEDVDLGEGENLDPPSDARLGIRHEDGGLPLELDEGGISNEVLGGFGSRVSIGDLDVPTSGDYEVVVTPTREARPDPEIVFGDDLFDGFVGSIPIGLLVLAAGVGVAAIVAAITFVLRRRFSHPAPGSPE